MTNSFYVNSCTKRQANLINIYKEMFFKMLIDVGHFSVLSPHTVDFLIRRKELIYNGEKQHFKISPLFSDSYETMINTWYM